MKIPSALIASIVFAAACAVAGEREYIWPEGKMPDVRTNQFARMDDEGRTTNRVAYIEWYATPTNFNGGCVIMVSGGAYNSCCDRHLVRETWPSKLSAAGFQCVNLCYRTPRPYGLPIYQTAWEDGQRAVRLVRSEAERRGIDPERIGAIGMSAGAHLVALLATSSQTPAYAPVDELDKVPCHLNFAITGSIAYGLTTGAGGGHDKAGGVGGVPAPEFKFDEKTCPMCLLHGAKDPFSPLASTQFYRELRRRKIPAEVHIWSSCGHGDFFIHENWWGCTLGFLRQLNLDRKLGKPVAVMTRFANDDARDGTKYLKEEIWPEGKMPDDNGKQGRPYIEWHFPKEQKTTAVQIVFSGGAYYSSDPNGAEVAPVRRFLNENGMTVVTLKYRAPRPAGLAKHVTAWQDLQRTIRIVRSKAEGLGLDPNRVGIMGFSAGGHLMLMGALSSTQRAYEPIDALDEIPCNVQWGVGVYPAYALTDGAEVENTTGGNDDSAVPVPEFAFDGKSCPVLFFHGDADGWAAMNSVKVWERLREKWIFSDVHTFVKGRHCFQFNAAEDTGAYTWMERLREYLRKRRLL